MLGIRLKHWLYIGLILVIFGFLFEFTHAQTTFETTDDITYLSGYSPIMDWNESPNFTQDISCSDLPSSGTIDSIDWALTDEWNSGVNLSADYRVQIQGESFSPDVTVNVTHNPSIFSVQYINFDIDDYDLANCSGSITLEIDSLISSDSIWIPGTRYDEYLNGDSGGNVPVWFVGDFLVILNITEPPPPPQILFLPYEETMLLSSSSCDFSTGTSTCNFYYETSTSSLTFQDYVKVDIGSTIMLAIIASILTVIMVLYLVRRY